MPQLTHRSAAPAPNAAVSDGTLLLSLNDLAVALRVSARTVARLAAAGQLPPALKIGRLRRWSRRAVEEWLAAGCPATRGASGQQNPQ
jgi:excisionase family DNA binding protein